MISRRLIRIKAMQTYYSFLQDSDSQNLNSLQRELEYLENNNSYDIEFIMLAYKNIDNESLKFSEEDLTSYYNEHQHKFMNKKR